MPLPKEMLDSMNEKLSEAEKSYKQATEVLAFMRKSGIDMLAQEERLRGLHETLIRRRAALDEELKKAG